MKNIKPSCNFSIENHNFAPVENNPVSFWLGLRHALPSAPCAGAACDDAGLTWSDGSAFTVAPWMAATVAAGAAVPDLVAAEDFSFRSAGVNEEAAVVCMAPCVPRYPDSIV